MRKRRRDYRPYSYDYNVMPLKTRYQMLLEKIQGIDIDPSKINVTAKINYDDINSIISKAIKDNPVNVEVPQAKIDPDDITSLKTLITRSKCEVIENMSSNCGGKSGCCTGSSLPTDQLATKTDVKNAVCQIISNTDTKVSEIPAKVKEELTTGFQTLTNNVNEKSKEIVAKVQIVKTRLDNKLDTAVFKTEATNINTKLDNIDTEVKKKLDSDVYKADVKSLNETFATINQRIDTVDARVQTVGNLVNDWGEKLVNL